MRTLILAFVLFCTTPFVASVAYSASNAISPELETRAEQFVDNLFAQFGEIYAEETTDSNTALLDYYLAHFDHAQISRFVFGGYGRRASKEQKARFFDLLPKFLLSQINMQVESYFSRDSVDYSVDVTSVRPLKKDHLMVLMHYSGLKKVHMKVRLRPVEEELKILDIHIAGISMLLTQRDLIASMIKQNGGDLDAFLDQLAKRV